MKKYITTILLGFLPIATLFAQQATVEIQGAKSVFVSTQRLKESNVKMSVAQVKSGNERLTIENVAPNELYILAINDRVTFYQPLAGKSVLVDATNDKFLFSGEGKKINNFLYELFHDLLYSIDNPAVGSYRNKVICTGNVVLDDAVLCDENYVEKVKALRDQSLKKLKKEKIKNKSLHTTIENAIHDLYWETIFCTYHNLEARGKTLPNSLIKIIKEYDFNNIDFKRSPIQNLIITLHIRVQERTGGIEVSLDDYIACKAKLIENEEIREVYIFRELEGLIKSRQFIFMMELINSCESLISEKNKVRFNEIKLKAQNMIAENKLDGVMAHPFEFENQDGKVISLSDFRGKYVYIDVWATWCGPCKQEIPKLQKLEQEMKGQNIEFISISVDKPKDKQQWKDFLKEKNMHGVTLITPNAFNAPFIKNYGINAIPRFMLIGPDGIMISSNCWRPSDPRLKEYLMMLMKKEN